MIVRQVALHIAILCLMLAWALELHAQGAPVTSSAAGAAQADIPKPMTLTEAQLNGFFGAMEDFKKMGAASTKAGASSPDAFARALRVSAESEAVVRKHGFADVPEFQRVAYNAAMAHAVLKEGGKDAVAQKAAKAKAEQAAALDKMRGHLPPDQVKMLAAQLEGATAQASAMQDVPPANVELIQKHRARMEQLGTR